MRIDTRHYVAAVVSAAVVTVTVAAAVVAPQLPTGVTAIAAFAAGTMLVMLVPIPVPRGGGMELEYIEEAVVVVALLGLHPAGMVVGVALGALAGQLVTRMPLVKALFNASQAVLVSLAAVLVVSLVAGPAPGPTPVGISAAILGLAAYFIANRLLIAGVMSRVLGSPFGEVLRDGWVLGAAMWAANVAVGLLLVLPAFEAPWLLFAALVPLALLYAAYRIHAQRKQQEHDLRELNAEAKRLKDDFVATVSHELRTPLTTVKGFVETLRREDISVTVEQREEFLALMSREVARLERLVGDLLDMNSIEAGGAPPVHIGKVDLARLVNETVRELRSTHEHAHLQVAGAVGSLFVDGDPGRIEQVLINLLESARKHAPGAPVQVTVRRVGRMGRVQVRDAGPGIAPAELERVFERFFVTANSATRTGGGIGLGLYICRQLMTAMGGRISASSTPGAGSVFQFDLPLRAASDTITPRRYNTPDQRRQQAGALPVS